MNKTEYLAKHGSKKALGTVFYVPNDDEGRAFLKLVEKYLNRAHYKIRIRGRGPRVVNDRRYFQELPLEYASYLAVYLPGKARDQEWKRLCELRSEIHQLQQILSGLKRDHKKALEEEAAELEKSVEKLMVRFGKRKIRV